MRKLPGGDTSRQGAGLGRRGFGDMEQTGERNLTKLKTLVRDEDAGALLFVPAEEGSQPGWTQNQQKQRVVLLHLLDRRQSIALISSPLLLLELNYSLAADSPHRQLCHVERRRRRNHATQQRSGAAAPARAATTVFVTREDGILLARHHRHDRANPTAGDGRYYL